jgi:hypothetical protein
MRDLRSADDAVRLKALHLLGLNDGLGHEQGRVVSPDRIELTYAALAEDATQQAVISVRLVDLQSMAAAVAVRNAARWKRIALFSCWCKYDMDALRLFVSFQRILENLPQMPWHFELVLHGSGGGTGVYRQSEAHYRMRSGRLVRVLSFECHTSHCDGGNPPPWFCEIEEALVHPPVVRSPSERARRSSN